MISIQALLQSTTNRLIAINLVAYFIIQALFAGAPNPFQLHPWQHPDFHLWQMFSYMFLHADFMHLLFNMLALWMFGRVLERAWGGRSLTIFFVLCGIGAAMVHLAYNHYEFTQLYDQFLGLGLSNSQIDSVYLAGRDISRETALVSHAQVLSLYQAYNTNAVGASGAIYGILVAFALLFPQFKIMLIFLPIPIAAKYFVPVLLLIDLTAGLTGITLFGRNIAHFAHLGGALAGFLLVQYWLREGRVRG